MDDKRKTGELVLKGPDVDERVRVFWELESGEIADAKTWTADISFTRDWRLPEKEINLIFKAMSEPAIRMWLETDDGAVAECVVHDIEDMEEGAVGMSSPSLGRVTMTVNKPNLPSGVQKERRRWPFRWPFL